LSNPQVTYETRQIPCQISCPFHGPDSAPSARVFPASNSMYCWACNKSWDVIDYWTEINEWWRLDELTGEDILDRGKAIKDLAYRYNLQYKKPDWKKSLDAALYNLDKKRKGYEALTLEEREELRDFYGWRMMNKLSSVPSEDRERLWDDVDSAWVELDFLDLSSDDWKKLLKNWYFRSTSLIS
ncbi:MAG: CHC2 zinc finger domain-containing protein, partial [Candidatus Bathyarchaeota archaeon]|nr:CHC2 zinc finger domain-containing protein [Candidatus Bathyarchaeota archaeon]